MPDVSFYVLSTESIEEKYIFACKLIEKAYRNKHFCYVLTDSNEQSQRIDDLLWTFRAGSFIPHQVYTGEIPVIENTVLIGSIKPPKNWLKTVINLSSQILQDFQQAERILEILDNSEASKGAGRLRYSHYNRSGISLTTHRMNLLT